MTYSKEQMVENGEANWGHALDQLNTWRHLVQNHRLQQVKDCYSQLRVWPSALNQTEAIKQAWPSGDVPPSGNKEATQEENKDDPTNDKGESKV